VRHRHDGTGDEQPDRGKQRPDVCLPSIPERMHTSGGRRERRFATSRKISLPVSAQEWAASARIEADPVTAAAADFASATRRLAAKATRTVVRLADAPCACDIRPSSSSESSNIDSGC
jgi:hypothetical protein